MKSWLKSNIPNHSTTRINFCNNHEIYENDIYKSFVRICNFLQKIFNKFSSNFDAEKQHFSSFKIIYEFADRSLFSFYEKIVARFLIKKMLRMSIFLIENNFDLSPI